MAEEEEIELTSVVDSENALSDVHSESELVPAVEQRMPGKIRSTISRLKSKIVKSESPDRGQPKLKKELTLFVGVAYVVGGIIGSGIFITPRTILCRTGSFGLSLIVWVIGGMIAMGGGICYIELSLLIKQSGAEFSFIKEAYSFRRRKLEGLGSFLSFLFLWSSMCVIRASSIAVISLTCARYLIRPFFIDCDSIPESAVKLLSLTIMSIITLLNCYSLKLASRVTSVFSVTKVLVVIFIAVVGVIYIITKERTFPDSFVHPFQSIPGREPTVSTFGASLYGALWAYNGWNVIGYASEEMKNARRNVPLSLFIGVPIVTLCYLLVNVSFFAILSYDEVLVSETIALQFGEATMGTAGLVVIPLLVSVSAFGAAMVSLFSASRVVFVAAREGHLPEFLSGVHATAKTPVPALIVQVSLAMLMATIGSIDQLIDGFAFVAFIFYTLVIIAVFILRITHRRESRLFKLWFILPVAMTMTLFCLFVVFVPLLSTPTSPLIAFGFLLLGVPVYFVFVMEKPWKLRPKCLDLISENLTIVVGKSLKTISTRQSQTTDNHTTSQPA